jgi:hypothetical protein
MISLIEINNSTHNKPTAALKTLLLEKANLKSNSQYPNTLKTVEVL